ncbi:MAG: flavodoxin family protein [Bacteroidota bacterium]
MDFLIILGSRNPEGQTAQAAGALRNGVEQAGGRAASVYLPELRLERCRQCGIDGWGTCLTTGRCSVEDDLASVVESISRAKATVFATPVYFGDVSESMSALLNRIRRTCIHEAGRARINGRTAIGICVAGGGGGGAPYCAYRLERLLAGCGFQVADTIPIRRQNLEQKLPALEALGRSLMP